MFSTQLSFLILKLPKFQIYPQWEHSVFKKGKQEFFENDEGVPPSL